MFLIVFPERWRRFEPWADTPEVPSQAVDFADDLSYWRAPVIWSEVTTYLLPLWQDDGSLPPRGIDEDPPWVRPILWLESTAQPAWVRWQYLPDDLPQLDVDDDSWSTPTLPWVGWGKLYWFDDQALVPILDEDVLWAMPVLWAAAPTPWLPWADDEVVPPPTPLGVEDEPYWPNPVLRADWPVVPRIWLLEFGLEEASANLSAPVEPELPPPPPPTGGVDTLVESSMPKLGPLTPVYATTPDISVEVAATKSDPRAPTYSTTPDIGR